MSEHDNLRDRIAKAIHREECSCGGDIAEEWELRWAQAIIDEFELTVSGDGCGYHEIYGSYDTRFGKWERCD